MHFVKNISKPLVFDLVIQKVKSRSFGDTVDLYVEMSNLGFLANNNRPTCLPYQ